jgi:hypothetical protein
MKNLGPFLQICILLGSAARGGSKIRSKQRGGAGLSQGSKQRLLDILNNFKVNFPGNTEVIKCIDTLITKFTAEKVDPNASEHSSETAAADTFNPLKLQADLNEVPVTEAASPQPNEQPLDKFKRIFNDKVKGTLNRKIERIKGKFTDEEYRCLITLKEAILNDVVSSIRTKIDDLKKNKAFLGEMAKNTLAAGKNALVGKITAFKDSEQGQALSAKKDAFLGNVNAFKDSEQGQAISAKKDALFGKLTALKDSEQGQAFSAKKDALFGKLTALKDSEQGQALSAKKDDFLGKFSKFGFGSK